MGAQRLVACPSFEEQEQVTVKTRGFIDNREREREKFIDNQIDD